MSLLGADGSYQDLLGQNASTLLVNVEDLVVTDSVCLEYANANENLVTNGDKCVISEAKDSFVDTTNQITWTNVNRAFIATLPQQIATSSNVEFVNVTASNALFTNIIDCESNDLIIRDLDDNEDIVLVADNTNFEHGLAWRNSSQFVCRIYGKDHPSEVNKRDLTLAAGQNADRTQLTDALSVNSATTATLAIGDVTLLTNTFFDTLTASKNLVLNSDKMITTNDQLLIEALTGTTNQVIITESPAGTFTFSTPQDIASTSDVTFESVIVNDGTFTSPALEIDTGGSNPSGFFGATINVVGMSINQIYRYRFQAIGIMPETTGLDLGSSSDKWEEIHSVNTITDNLTVADDTTLSDLSAYDVVYLNGSKVLTGINLDVDFVLVGRGSGSAPVAEHIDVAGGGAQNELGTRWDQLKTNITAAGYKIIENAYSIFAISTMTGERRAMGTNFIEVGLSGHDTVRRFGIQVFDVENTIKPIYIGFCLSTNSLTPTDATETGSYSVHKISGAIHENGVNVATVASAAWTDEDLMEFEIKPDGKWIIYKNTLPVYFGAVVVSGQYYPQIFEYHTGVNDQSFTAVLRYYEKPRNDNGRLNDLGSVWDPLKAPPQNLITIFDNYKVIEALTSTNTRMCQCVNSFTIPWTSAIARRFGIYIKAWSTTGNIYFGCAIDGFDHSSFSVAQVGVYAYGESGNVYENGVSLGVFGSGYGVGDTVEMVARANELYYFYVNGHLQFTSTNAFASNTYYPFTADSSPSSSSFTIELRPTTEAGTVFATTLRANKITWIDRSYLSLSRISNMTSTETSTLFSTNAFIKQSGNAPNVIDTNNFSLNNSGTGLGGRWNYKYDGEFTRNFLINWSCAFDTTGATGTKFVNVSLMVWQLRLNGTTTSVAQDRIRNGRNNMTFSMILSLSTGDDLYISVNSNPILARTFIPTLCNLTITEL